MNTNKVNLTLLLGGLVLLFLLSASFLYAKEEIHCGDTVRVTKGFYSGCVGIAMENREEDKITEIRIHSFRCKDLYKGDVWIPLKELEVVR